MISMAIKRETYFICHVLRAVVHAGKALGCCAAVVGQGHVTATGPGEEDLR